MILHSKLRVGVWSCIKVCTGVGDANTHREVGYKRALELSGMGSGGRQQERPSKVASAGVSVEATEGNGYHKEACCWSFPRWFPGGANAVEAAARGTWRRHEQWPGQGRGRRGSSTNDRGLNFLSFSRTLPPRVASSARISCPFPFKFIITSVHLLYCLSPPTRT